MISDFKKFLLKQNIVSLAIAVVIGAALAALVKALVDAFIMPVIGAFLPAGDWQTFTMAIGPVRFGVGSFLAALMNFLIVAFVAWRLAKMFITEETPPATKPCPHCRMRIDPAATRCPHCTSQLTSP